MSPEQGPGKGGRYARCGTVTARRLEHALQWATSHGDVLRSEAGDWWVESATGGGRGVSAAEFPKLYRHVEGDVFARVGEVYARRTTDTEEVGSLEGDAIARAGSWVITDDGGNSWVVPNTVFQREYRPIES